jgi:hypothetical protein
MSDKLFGSKNIAHPVFDKNFLFDGKGIRKKRHGQGEK